MEDIQNSQGKEWTQIQQDHLQEDKEEHRRLCHMTIHPGGNVNELQ
jgi:hypothetical protein